MRQFTKIVGRVFIFSGLGHAVGVLRFYMAEGVPDANRILLDIWIAEALFLGGGLYLVASSGAHSGKSSRVLAIFGSLTIIGFTLPMTPVLFGRAPLVFLIPAVLYFVLSVLVLIQTVRQKSEEIG